jgi:hypothetical protein
MLENKARDVDFLYEELNEMTKVDSGFEFLSRYVKTHPGISMVYKDYLLNKNKDIDSYFYDDSKIYQLYTRDDIFTAIEEGSVIATTPENVPTPDVEPGYTYQRICWIEEELIDLNLKFSSHTVRIKLMYTYKFYIKIAELIRKLKQKKYITNRIVETNSTQPNSEIQPTNEKTNEELEYDKKTFEEYRKKIIQQFKTMDGGWEYAFIFEDEYLGYVDILARFFNNNPYEKPIKGIKIKKNSKTLLTESLIQIYRKCKPHGAIFKYDLAFFEVVRILEPFNIMSPDKLLGHLQKF